MTFRCGQLTLKLVGWVERKRNPSPWLLVVVAMGFAALDPSYGLRGKRPSRRRLDVVPFDALVLHQPVERIVALKHHARIEITAAHFAIRQLVAIARLAIRLPLSNDPMQPEMYIERVEQRLSREQ